MGALDYKTRRHRRNRLAAEMAATYHPRKHFRLGQDIGWHWQIDDPNTLYRRRNRLTYTNDLSAISLGNLTRTLGASTTPDGTSATRLAVTVSTTSTIANTGAAITSTSAIARMFVMVKQVSGTPGARFLIRNSTTASDGDAITINYTTGAVTGSGAITQGVSHSLGSGWWLLVLTRTTGLTAGDGVICYFGWLGDAAVTAGAAIDIAKVQLDFGDATTSQAAVQAAYQPVPTTWAQAYLDAVGAERIYAWTDTAGTTPVTAVGQGIGLLLGREYGGATGPSLLANGATGLTGTATAASYSTSTFAGSVSRAGDASNQSWVTWTGLTTSAVHRIRITNTGATSLDVRNGGVAGTIVASIAAGTSSWVHPATTGGSTSITITATSNSTTATFTLGQFAVLPGTHLTQATGTAKPTLSARVNLLLATELLSNAAWTKTQGGTGVAPVVTDSYTTDDQGKNATRIQLNKGAGATGADFAYASQVVSGSITGTSYRERFYIKATSAGEAGKIVLIRQAAGSAYTQITLTNSWQLVTLTETAVATSITCDIILRGTFGSSNSADFLLSQIDLRPADDAAKNIPAYQWVGATAADHDTDGFPHYAEGDGTDNCWASVATVDGSATDKVTVVAAVTKLSDASVAVLMELTADATANNGGFYVAAPPQLRQPNYGIASRGSASVTVNTANSYAAPLTNVLAFEGNIGSDVATLRAGSALAATTSSDQGTGNYANATLHVLSRAGTSFRFNGRFYGSTGRFGPMSDSERNNLTRWWQKRIGTA